MDVSGVAFHTESMATGDFVRNMRVAWTAIVGIAMMCLPGYGTSPLPDDCWGVYSWAGWNTEKVTRERCPLIKGAPIILKWKQVEPEPGRFTFEGQLDDKLRRAVSITCNNSNTWKELNLTLGDARFGHEQSERRDLILLHLSGSNTVFHMIELQRR